MSIPAVQTNLGKRVTKRLNDDFKTDINIDRISLQLNGDVELIDILIRDYKKDTLISASEINTSILNFRTLYYGNLVFGDIDAESLFFHVKTYLGETDTNLDIFVEKFEKDNPSPKKSKFLMSSSDVSLYDSTFKLTDENRETKNLVEFNELNINATNFLINGSEVSMRVNTLNFTDSRGIKLKNLITNFKYTLSDMTFGDLKINTDNSVLKGDLKFLYDREDLQFFTDKVLVEANFKDSELLLNELNTFYNEFGSNQSAKFSVNLSGTLNDLKTNNLRLTTNTGTRINGDVNFRNLFSKASNDFYMNGDFKRLTSSYSELNGLLPNVLGASIPSSFDRLGRFTIKGKTKVTSSEVFADVIVNTSLGLIESQIEINKINDIDNASYRGNIVFDAFDFGAFLENPKVGEGSLNVDVDGDGFTVENVNSKVKGDIFQMQYNGYNYSKIKVAGNVRNGIFDGNLVVNDRNLDLDFNGLVDFSEKLRKYDFEAKVGYANLKALNFVKKDSVAIFRSRVNMNMNASGFDDAYGRLVFRNTTYKNDNDKYVFKKFAITSRFKEAMRFIEFNSPDIVQGDIKGVFAFRDLKKLFENSLGHIYTNYSPHEVKTDQTIDFNFRIYNKIIEVVYPELQLGKNTFIRGRVESDETKFQLTFKSPEIKLLDYTAKDIELQVDNSNPVFNTYVEIDTLNNDYYKISDFSLINVTVNDTLFMRTEFNGGKRNNDSYNLNFYHTINEEEQSVVGFKKSNITIKDNKWYINESEDKFHKIAFNKALTKFNLDKFVLRHQDQEVALSGFLDKSTEKDINLDFTNVDLEKITPDLDSLTFGGTVNGNLDVIQKKGRYLPKSTITIDNLEVNHFVLGSFNANIEGNESLTNFSIDASIKDDNERAFAARGDININGSEASIDVGLDFNKLQLGILNPLLQDVLSNIRGEVTGGVRVVGDLKRPDINGKLKVYNGGLGIPYLNVDYNFGNVETVDLSNQTFNFNTINLIDTKFDSKGKLTGSLSHINFSSWSLDLDIETPRLVVLDTEEQEESLYYGTGFIGGSASIEGPTEQLRINVIGETKEGTVFKIPLSDSESFGDNSYIHFITKKEKQAKKKGVDIVFNEIEGLELDFDLDVTENAEVEVIIDKNTGHSLRGRGRGGLLVEINTNGKFNMWGDFSVFEGVYNFAYKGLIRKEFTVQPGGTINWEGDPLKASIDMLAVYKIETNPSPLLDNPINRSIPVELNIALVGQLEQPEPEFSFDFPNVNSTIKSELQYRLDTKDERENQALYLISTGSFAGGVGNINFSGTIAERLNGILNNIFSNGDGKLNIGVNYEAGQNRPDYRTDDRVDVTLQTQINDRVLINGNIGVPIGGATETVIAGDVEIDFLLNEEGTLIAKIFNRENSIRNFGEDIGYTQGVGISYNLDFDTFKELIQNFLKKSESIIELEETEVESEEDTEEENSPLPDYISVKSDTN